MTKPDVMLLLIVLGLGGGCADRVVTPQRSGLIDRSDSDRPVQILKKEAERLISPSASLKVLGDGYLWSEGPLWIADGGYLLFSDIPNNVILKFEPDVGIRPYLAGAGATGRYPSDDQSGPNGLLLDPDGKLVVMQHGDRRVARMTSSLDAPTLQFETLAARFEGKRLNSPNDGVYHSDGSLYFTDPPYGMKDGFEDARKELPFQGVFRLSAEAELSLLDDSVPAPNGIALSRDERTLYLASSDQKRPTWFRYDVLADGSLDNRRVLHDASYLVGKEGEQGLPDGMVMHSSGNLFATGPGGVWIFSPDGDVLGKIRTGKQTANCTLSADERTLYMTAHDTLMSIELRVP